jgi:hypothetical protein
MALLGLAISPISWWHHYVIALLPFMYFWCTMERGAGRLGLTLLVFAVGTNLIGIAGTIFDTSRLLPALAAVTPILTVGVCFAAIGKRPRIVRVY